MRRSLFALAFLLAFHDPAFGAVASYYCEPQAQACGGRYNPSAMTAAHKSLPCGTVLAVSRGSAAVTVTVTDRGPYIRGRDLDLSCAAAGALHMKGVGVSPVNMRVVSMGHPRTHHRGRHKAKTHRSHTQRVYG